MPAARYWRAIGLQPYAGKALELSALHLYLSSGISPFRYFRLTNLTTPSSFLEIGELQITMDGARLAGATLSASSAPTEALANLGDDNVSTRCYWTQSTVQNAGFWLQFDFGAPVTANGIRQSGFDTSGRHLSGFTLSVSNNAADWTTVATFSGLSYPGNYTYSSPYAFSLPSSTPSRLDAPATLTSAIAPTSGTLAALQDDNTATVCRWADVSAPGFALQWDFGGSPQDVGAVRLGAGTLQNEFLEAVTLQSSSDGATWSSGASLGRFAWPGANAMTDAGAAPLALQLRPSAGPAGIVLSGGLSAPVGTVASPTAVRLDLQDGGLYRTYGTVELTGTPNLLLRRRVELWNQRDKRMVRETWSDATTGAWAFDHIRGGDGTRYCAVAYDHTGQKQAVIADNLVPEAMSLVQQTTWDNGLSTWDNNTTIWDV